jgi:hypothetical protein
MDGYMLIASGIGFGIILLIVAVKLYEHYGSNSHETQDPDKLSPTPH